jgi:VanZ family protein
VKTGHKKTVKVILLCTWLGCLTVMGVLSLIPDLFTAGHNEDKNLHMLAYAVMSAGAIVILQGKKLPIAALAFLFFLGWGIEYAQSVIGGRESSVYDGFANVMGMGIGIVSGLLIKLGYKKSALDHNSGN